MGIMISVLAGLVCGVISGLGIGGGSILMIWLTAAVGMEQRAAQGINLLYFLPTALASLCFHVKNKLVRWDIAIPAAICGSVTALAAAYFAQQIETGLLRRLFGGFLLLVAIGELRRAKKPGHAES